MMKATLGSDVTLNKEGCPPSSATGTLTAGSVAHFHHTQLRDVKTDGSCVSQYSAQMEMPNTLQAHLWNG